jgi:hypothetical protein
VCCAPLSHLAVLHCALGHWHIDILVAFYVKTIFACLLRSGAVIQKWALSPHLSLCSFSTSDISTSGYHICFPPPKGSRWEIFIAPRINATPLPFSLCPRALPVPVPCGFKALCVVHCTAVAARLRCRGLGPLGCFISITTPITSALNNPQPTVLPFRLPNGLFIAS